MAILGSKSDFQPKVRNKVAKCGECGVKFPRDHVWLVSIRDGVPRKYVCSEGCREAFDDKFWQERADARERGEI